MSARQRVQVNQGLLQNLVDHGDVGDGETTAERKRCWFEHLAIFGITRVGCSTEFDTLGVPVWFACRPNSRSLSVAQGKGLTDEDAWVSAVGEAIESAVAETDAFVDQAKVSVDEMQAFGKTIIALDRQARCDVSRFDHQRARSWVKGNSIRTGQPVWAPYELVGMDMRQNTNWDRYAFRMTSNGLAAHPNRMMALNHALRELVEEDAFAATVALPSHRNRQEKSLLSAADVDRLVPGLSSRLQQQGLVATFHQVNKLIDIPVVMVDLLPMQQSGNVVTASGGCGCSLSLERAVRAALLEAVQSRLTLIAGAREDLDHTAFDNTAGIAALQVTGQHAPIHWPDLPHDLCPESEYRILTERLHQAGIDDAYVFDLGTHGPGIHVVRVLADDLLSSEIPAQACHGGRMARRLLQAWLS